MIYNTNKLFIKEGKIMLMQDFQNQKSKNGLQTISMIATKVVTDIQEKENLTTMLIFL